MPETTQPRPPAVGMSLFERVLVVGVLLFIAVGTAAVVGSCRSVCDGGPKRQRAHEDIVILESAAQMALIEQSGGPAPCPTVEGMVTGGLIADTGALTADPWGRPYVIACDEGVARARSAGADGVLGSHDDP